MPRVAELAFVVEVDPCEHALKSCPVVRLLLDRGEGSDLGARQPDVHLLALSPLLLAADRLGDPLLAEEVVTIFSKLWDVRFPIHSIRPMTEFAGDDGLSMAANNSSCFNARRIVGTERLSLHSYGAAIDINPVQNPVIRDGEVRPAAGAAYQDRSNARPGMILEGGPALDIFLDAGWLWGGHWENPLDYHHFYRPDSAG